MFSVETGIVPDISRKTGRKINPEKIFLTQKAMESGVMDVLRPREKGVLLDHLNPNQPVSLEDLRPQYGGVTRARIGQIEDGAINKIRRVLRGEPVKKSRKKGAYLDKLPDEEVADLLNPRLTHTEIANKYGEPWSTVQGRRKVLGVHVKMGRPKKK